MKVKLVTLSLVVFSLLSLSSCSAMSDQVHSKGYETYIQLGDTFKHSSFTDINDESVVLGNKQKLIILFATWCSDSQRTFKALKSSPLYNNPKLQIIGIGREESVGSLKEFNDEYQLNFKLVSDLNREIYSQYANKGIPRLIVLDANNQVMQTLIAEEENSLTKIKL
jgi:peroxiredoxin